MGHHLARLGLLTMPTTAMLGGCSLIYNPNNLPGAADAAPDVLVDGNPADLALEDVKPSVIVEGAGVGGSRPAVLVISGRNIVKQNTRVSITAGSGSARTPMLVIDQAQIEVDVDNQRLAVPITLPVDPMLNAGETIPLDVTVTQDGAPQPGKLTGKLALKGLAELVDGKLPAGGFLAGLSEFSQIDVKTGTIASASMQAGPIILRSTSSVSIATAISVSAAGREGGPGGGRGGMGGGVAQNGGAGTGPSAGTTSGAPGGFASTDVQLGTLGDPNRSSGGAGGDGGVGTGGVGGGGGGSIEITAAGTLVVSNVSSTGAAGGAGALGGNAGGGGSGGVVLLRAGAAATSGTINVSGGGAGAAAGRVRVDAGQAITMPACSGCYRGPMLV
ncbi:MAG TPA: hypothetical protein VN253_30215, partial [Kofleriaceae bacterium]|nr:hypothetical protein [Kofleriaceae bacterium]